MSHLPQDEVRGRSGAYLQLLQHPLLRAVRREGHPSLKQGNPNANLSIAEHGVNGKTVYRTYVRIAGPESTD